VHNPAVRKTRRYLLVTLLIAVLGFAPWLLLRPDPEPTYQGKPLTDWCYQYAGNSFLDSNTELQKQAETAIRTIGTNAIPTLLRMLQARDSKFKLMLMQLSQKQHVVNINWKTAQIQHDIARVGFSVLGSDGKSAVPALLEIYCNCRPSPYDDRGNIAEIIALIGPAVEDAVPRFVQDTTDTNLYIRWSAISALGRIHARPDLAVPVLIRSLHDQDGIVREEAACSLAAFGNNARSAAPELIKTLTDPYPGISNAVAYALKKIDPAAAAQAGVK